MPESEAGAGGAGKHIVFSVLGRALAFPASIVAEVAMPEPAHPIPLAPAWALGIIALRSVPHALLDAGLLLFGEPGPRGKALVLRDGAARAALLVDDVSGMADVAALLPAFAAAECAAASGADGEAAKAGDSGAESKAAQAGGSGADGEAAKASSTGAEGEAKQAGGSSADGEAAKAGSAGADGEAAKASGADAEGEAKQAGSAGAEGKAAQAGGAGADGEAAMAGGADGEAAPAGGAALGAFEWNGQRAVVLDARRVLALAARGRA